MIIPMLFHIYVVVIMDALLLRCCAASPSSLNEYVTRLNLRCVEYDGQIT